MLDIKKIETDFEAVKKSLACRNFDTNLLNLVIDINKQKKNIEVNGKKKNKE